MIEKYKNTPIPKRSKRVTTRDFGIIEFDEASSDNDEDLLDALQHGLSGESYYSRTDGFNAPYYETLPNTYNTVFLREGLVQQLLKVNAELKTADLELFLLDGHRPISVQQSIWDFFMKRAEDVLDNPNEQQKEDFVVQYASDPRKFNIDDPTSWPLHSTGGAIDLTLKRLNFPEIMYMGCIFDDPAPQSGTHFFEDKLINDPENFSSSDQAALENRRILYHAMINNGFTNFDFEIWHYDFKTQLWALTKNIEEDTNKYKASYKTTVLENNDGSNVIKSDFF